MRLSTDLLNEQMGAVGGAVIKMRVEDVYVQGHRTWLRLHEKGGKCPHHGTGIEGGMVG